MLQKEAALPGPKGETPIGKWNIFAGTRKGHLDVAGHIVRTFDCMSEICIFLGYQSFHPGLKIMARTWVSVFHYDQAATGVTAEYGHQAIGHARFRQKCFQLPGDLIGAFTLGSNFNRLLSTFHCRYFRKWDPPDREIFVCFRWWAASRNRICRKTGIGVAR